jgi:hypothetical protein
MPSVELGRRLLLWLLRPGQHLQRLFDRPLEIGRSIRTAANVRGHRDICARPGGASGIGNDDIGRQLELDSAKIDSISRDAIEIDKWRIFGPQRSGANRWRLDGLGGRFGHDYLPRLWESETTTNRGAVQSSI